MKVIKPGKTEEKWYGQCNKCKAVLEAETSELTITAGNYRSDHESFAWTDCPECKEAHSVCFHMEGTKSAELDRRR